MLYFVTVEGTTLQVDLRGETPSVDGIPLGADLASVQGGALRHLLLDGESYALLVERGERRGEWRVALNGRTLDVEVIDERTRTIREMAGGAEAEVDKVVVAPMPGLVVSVSVKPGEQVHAGQGLVVIEAMKMENELRSPSDGTVASIEVAPGDTVEKSAILLTLE